MLFKNRRLKVVTAITVLVAFTWMAAGGNAWAEARSLKRHPAQVLLDLADDPRLALSPQEKEYLRSAARRLEEPQSRTEAVHIPASHAAPDPVVELKALSQDLDLLARGAENAKVPEKKNLNDGLARIKGRLEVIDKAVLRQFAETEASLRAAHLPPVIFARHEAARSEYVEKMQTVLGSLDAAEKSQTAGEARTSIAAAAELLGKSTDERPSPRIDPSRLPFRKAQPTARKPAIASPDGRSLKALTLAEKLVAPTAADLAANEDAQITPEIRALAASLGNQPLKIYDWVRNNVEFVPTYGSVQGSEMTLESKRGNAFDIASLLIALLRSAGVPAKYVTGTIEVPVDAAMNWVGGAASPAVAQQLLGQGGIPNVGLVSGGQVVRIRMSHVWVEAFIDYVPSRGTVQRQGDTWVPMDASFKLHNFTSQSALFTDNPISTVLQPGDHLFDVDESLGKITNVDDSVLDQRFLDWVTRSDDYSLANGLPTTVDGLLGGAVIIPQVSSTFAGALPYPVLTRAAGVSTLPASLRCSVTLNGFSSDLDRAFGTQAFSVKLSLPALNSHRLSIQFEPATQADADTLKAARDSGASSLPVYLVNVVPVIRLDGVEQGRGGSVRMGSFYPIDVVLQDTQGPTTVPYQGVAGDEIVAGVTGNGVSREIVEKRFANNPVNNAPEYLHQVALHYWAECDYLAGITARSLGVHMLRLPSVGFFSSPLTASYLFGVPRSGVYQSRIMDVKQSLLGAAGTGSAKVVAFMKQAGVEGSYLEGSVFDQLEGQPNSAIRGISSIHLIANAAELGIPIYRITPANSAAVLPLLQLSSAVKNDISTALSQGKTVMVPERNFNSGAWYGVGYIIQDETTGAGAYLISGGAAGGGLIDCLKELVPKWVQVLLIALIIALLILLIVWLLGGLAAVLAGLAGAGAAAAEAFTAFLLALRALSSLSLAY